MSTATASIAPSTAAAPVTRGDSLATGVMFMLVLNIVQRGVGFVRGLLFCRLLSEESLGLFSLANSFLILAPPLVVLSLPSTLGRYIEYYRQRGQLSAYLKKLTIASLALAGVGTLLMACAARPLAWLVFDDVREMRLLLCTLVTTALVVLFNYFNELLTGLRQMRAVSWMQFVNSLTFTLAGVGLVLAWESSAEAIVLAYALSCIAAVIAVAPWWSELRREFRHDKTSLSSRDAVSKLIPFAGWIWLTNLLANLGDFVDRFLIMHASGLDSSTAQAMIGQYHSSRVVPILLGSLGVTIAAVVLPHWSQAWERGDRVKVSAQTNLAVKLVSVLFTAAALAFLWASPLLFGVILGGRYDSGLAALPWALVGCLWIAILVVGQTYLMCAERAKFMTVAFAMGVLANVLFSWYSLAWGMNAIMAARAWATLTTALIVFAFNTSLGMKWTRGLTLALLMPLSVAAGAYLGSALLIAVLVLNWRTHWFFNREEEQQLRELAVVIVGKIKQKFSLAG